MQIVTEKSIAKIPENSIHIKMPMLESAQALKVLIFLMRKALGITLFQQKSKSIFI